MCVGGVRSYCWSPWKVLSIVFPTRPRIEITPIFKLLEMKNELSADTSGVCLGS